MKRALKAAAAMIAAICATAAHADFPVRFIEWSEDAYGMKQQACWHDDEGYQWIALPASEEDRRVSVAMDIESGSERRLEQGVGEVTLSWTDDGVERTRSVSTEESAYEYSNIFGHNHRIYLHPQALRPAVGADRAALRVDADLSGEVSYDIDAIADLFAQWFSHWCVDEDLDGYCDPTDIQGGLFVLPHMRAAEQIQVAECLNDHHFQSGALVQRQEGQIGGPVDWAAEAVWAAECPVPDDAPDLPEGGKKVSASQMCANFWGALYGTDSIGFFCFGDTVTVLEDGTELTGYQIRYWLDRARGAFPGFTCPASASAAGLQQTSGATSKSRRLRPGRGAQTFAPGRQVNVRTRPVTAKP